MLSLILALSAVQSGYVPAPSKVVVYEANLRALGPKVGFNALTARLDSIKGLGVNVLWLMPIQPVGKLRSAGGMGSPYSVANYDAINPEFGTSEDFVRLVEAAHKRKMAIIIDWVANHTAWDNPWIKSHPDWYTKDSKGNIAIPEGTNWQDVADLNYDNQAMRTAMIASMKGWLRKYNLDGFRFDTTDYVPFDFWKDAVPALRQSVPRPLFLLAEGFRADHYKAGFDLTYGWPFFDGLKDIYQGAKATKLSEAVKRELNDIPVGSRRLRFSTNHDKSAWEGTPEEFFKTSAGAKGAFLATVLYGGTPLIYTGQEVDWQKRIPIFDQSTIDWSKNRYYERWMGSVIALRNSNSALNGGELTDLSTDDAILFLKKQGTQRALVVVNVRNVKVEVSIPKSLQGTWKEGLTGKKFTLSIKLTLEPYGQNVWVQ